MSEKLDEIETKIITTLETQLSNAIKNRDAIEGLPGLKPPEFWTHQADFIRLTQEIGRRKRRINV